MAKAVMKHEDLTAEDRALIAGVAERDLPPPPPKLTQLLQANSLKLLEQNSETRKPATSPFPTTANISCFAARRAFRASRSDSRRPLSSGDRAAAAMSTRTLKSRATRSGGTDAIRLTAREPGIPFQARHRRPIEDRRSPR